MVFDVLYEGVFEAIYPAIFGPYKNPTLPNHPRILLWPMIQQGFTDMPASLFPSLGFDESSNLQRIT
jgi:hypothetical protein